MFSGPVTIFHPEKRDGKITYRKVGSVIIKNGMCDSVDEVLELALGLSQNVEGEIPWSRTVRSTQPGDVLEFNGKKYKVLKYGFLEYSNIAIN